MAAVILALALLVGARAAPAEDHAPARAAIEAPQRSSGTILRLRAETAAPVLGQILRVTATVTDRQGRPLGVVPVQFFVDGEPRSSSHTDGRGNAVLTFTMPDGPGVEIEAWERRGGARTSVALRATDIVTARLRLRVEPTEVNAGDPVVATAAVLDQMNRGLPDLTVRFEPGGQAVTDEEGVARVTLPTAEVGRWPLRATWWART